MIAAGLARREPAEVGHDLGHRGGLPGGIAEALGTGGDGQARREKLLGVIVAFAIVFLDPPLVLLTVAVIYVAVGLLLSLWRIRKGTPQA